MIFDVITIFPKLIEAQCNESIMAKAIENKIVTVNIHDLRDFTTDSRRTVDDKVFGGSPGMLLQIEPIYKALVSLDVYPNRDEDTKVVLTSAKGILWNQKQAKHFSTTIKRLVIICGRYEGVDARVTENLIDMEISIGNYVLTGGELAANILIDSTSRLLPGVLGNADSLKEESHNTENTSEYPQYTRPASFTTNEGSIWNVPEILISGNHKAIEDWQRQHTQSNI